MLTAALLRNRQKRLHIVPVENGIVDASIDDGAIEVQRHNVAAVGRRPTKLDELSVMRA